MIFDRTFHPDEANQAFTVGKLLQSGAYTYNPADHHGPTLYYAAVPVQRMFGAKDTASLEEVPLRLVPVVFAILTIVFAAMAVRRLVGRRSSSTRTPWFATTLRTLLALLPLATLPILFFYGTYFVQEALLGCFLAGMFWCGVEYVGSRERAGRVKPGTWALGFGVFAGLAFATKETSVIAFAAAGLAALPFRRRLASLPKGAGSTGFASHAALAIIAGLITSVVLFSSFGANAHGVYAAFIDAPLSYLGRARGSAASAGAADHVHVWWWYLKILLGYPIYHCRALAALFIAGLVLCRRSTPAVRYLALYAAISLALYSLVPYKTPWCMLAVVEAFALAAGLAPADAVESFARDGRPLLKRLANGPLLTLCLLAFVLHAQCRQCRKINLYPDNPLVPFNYANASWDVKNSSAFVLEQLAKAGPGAFAAVCLPPEDTWPLPWYLRRGNAGYWTSLDALPVSLDAHPAALVLLSDDPANDRVALRFPELNGSAVYGIRPGVLSTVYYRDEGTAAEAHDAQKK